MGRTTILLVAALGFGGCTETKSTGKVAVAPVAGVITHHDQLEAAVGQEVTIVGLQSRTKQPTVCGADVDGDYALSDREVTVRGILHRLVTTDVDPMTANRGPGTFYSVVDPKTGELAKTTLR